MDDHAKFQAVLAGLPIHAIPIGSGICAHHRGGCLLCPGAGRAPGEDSAEASDPFTLTMVERLEAALRRAGCEYPKHREALLRLSVVHVGLDCVILADHERRELHTAARGTDINLNHLTTPRDLSNNALVFCGWNPWCRTLFVEEDYRRARGRYPGYRSFGCGHSLGGNVVQELARIVQLEPECVFDRVDVFNTGGSPLQQGLEWLTVTEFNAHSVRGDVISKYHRAPGQRHEWERKPEFPAHSLGHFVPPRHLPSADDLLRVPGRITRGLSRGLCEAFGCGGLRHCMAREGAVVSWATGESPTGAAQAAREEWRAAAAAARRAAAAADAEEEEPEQPGPVKERLLAPADPAPPAPPAPPALQADAAAGPPPSPLGSGPNPAEPEPA